MFVEKAYASVSGWDFEAMAQEASNASFGDFMVGFVTWVLGVVVLFVVMRMTLTSCFRLMELDTDMLPSFLVSPWMTRMWDKIQNADEKTAESEEDARKNVEAVTANVSTSKPAVAAHPAAATSMGCTDFELDKSVSDIIAGIDMSGFKDYID